MNIQAVDPITALLLLLGVGFLVAERAAGLELRPVPEAPPGRAAHLAEPEAAATTRSALAIGVALGLLVFVQGRVHPPAGVRRDDDVRLLRVPAAAQPDASAAASTRTASGPTRRSSPTTRSAASAGAKASTRSTLIVISRLRNLARRLDGARRATTARRAACCATRSASTRSISRAPAWTSASTTSGTRRRRSRVAESSGRRSTPVRRCRCARRLRLTSGLRLTTAD